MRRSPAFFFMGAVLVFGVFSVVTQFLQFLHRLRRAPSEAHVAAAAAAAFPVCSGGDTLVAEFGDQQLTLRVAAGSAPLACMPTVVTVFASWPSSSGGAADASAVEQLRQSLSLELISFTNRSVLPPRQLPWAAMSGDVPPRPCHLGVADGDAAASVALAAASRDVLPDCRRFERVLPLRAAPEPTDAATIAAPLAQPRAGEVAIGAAVYYADTSSGDYALRLQALPRGVTAVDVARAKSASVAPHDQRPLAPLACAVTALVRLQPAPTASQAYTDGRYCREAQAPERDVREHVQQRYGYVCPPVLHLPAPLAAHFAVIPDAAAQGARGAPHAALASPPLRTEHFAARQGEELRLLVAPALEVAAQFPGAVRRAAFVARAVSADKMYAASFEPGFPYDDAAGGYRLRVAVRDAGAYTLDVLLSEFWGADVAAHFTEFSALFAHPRPAANASWAEDAFPGGPTKVGAWMMYGTPGSCLWHRAIVGGASAVLAVAADTLPAGMPLWSHARCTTADEPGRWHRLPASEACAPPVCSGDREHITRIDWSGPRREWVWVPFACHYHIFQAADVAACAEAQRLAWVLVMGDSTVREFFGNMMAINASSESYGKFDAIDAAGLPPPLRVTFQMWKLSFEQSTDIMLLRGGAGERPFWLDRSYLDHFNVLPSASSGAPWQADPRDRTVHIRERAPSENSHLASAIDTREETERPDVFIANGGHVFETLTFGLPEVQEWTRHFLGNVSAALAGDPALVRKGKPMRAMWVIGPTILASPHAGAATLSVARASAFSHATAALARAVPSVEIVDAAAITAARWEDTWDGVHYLRDSNGVWLGLVSSMVAMAELNALFRDCALPRVPPA